MEIGTVTANTKSSGNPARAEKKRADSDFFVNSRAKRRENGIKRAGCLI